MEGKVGGLDQVIYREAYRGFTVVPVASCGQVIQLVRSFRDQRSLHWLHCAGLVDRDIRSIDAGGLWEEGLYVLPVNELENLFLLPDVFLVLAAALSFGAEEAARRLARLKDEVFDLAARDADRVSLKHTSARIHEAGRTFGVKARDIADLVRLYADLAARTDPEAIYDAFRTGYELQRDDQGANSASIRMREAWGW